MKIPRREVIRFVAWFMLLFLISQVPLYAVRYPDIADFPNHLARLYVLTQLDHSAVLRQFYIRVPGISTNVVLDAMGPPLVNMVGLELALKVFASLCTLLLASGTVALNVALTRNLTPLALGSLLFAHDASARFGLFNYLFGIGLALWFLALWIGMRSRGVSISVALIGFAPTAVLIYLCHLSATGVFLLGIFAYEYSLQPAISRWRRLARASAIAVCVALPTLFLHLWTHRAGISNAGLSWSSPLAFALYKLVVPFLLPSRAYAGSHPVTALLIIAIFWLVYRGYKNGHIRFSRSGLAMAAALGLAMAVLPNQGLGSLEVDLRLALPLMLLLWASLEYEPTQGSGPKNLTLLIALGVVALAADTTRLWLSSDGKYAELRNAMRAIPEASKVAVSTDSAKDFDPSPNSAALAVIDRSVFLSSFYLSPFQPFTVAYRPEFVQLAELARQDDLRGPAPLDVLRGKYDYVVAFGHEPVLSRYAGRAKVMFRSRDALLLDLH